MKLSWHFTLEEAIYSETAVRKCIDNTPNSQQITNMRVAAIGMESVRDILDNKPVNVSSWFRNSHVNKLVGGASTSTHIDGYSIDFKCPLFGDPKVICKALMKSGIKFDQLIFEGTWVHISFDPRVRGEVMTAVFAKGCKTKYIKGIV